jgi:DNA mismatch repair protein MutL
MAADLLEVDLAETGLRLSGLIGPPGVNRSTRHEMLMFVNRRPVDSRTLNYALIESYATSLAKGRYPVAVLFLDLDPAAVDVNVHPAKREVRFRSEGAVRGFVIRAVLQRLREHGLPGQAGSGEQGSAFAKATADRAWSGQPSQTRLQPPAEQMPGDPVRPVAAQTPVPSVMSQPFRPFTSVPARPLALPVSPAFANPLPAPGPVRRSLGEGGSPLPASSLMQWRFLGTAHGDYALFEAPGGIVVLDRRAAHERIWFERLQGQFVRGEAASQRLLFALPVELDAIASALLLDRLKFLQAHGLEVAEFGRNFFRIEAVPVWLEPADAETFLRDVIGLMREGRLDEKRTDLAHEELARLAAQKAVRLPASVTEAEALALVAQLFACNQPHTSPAGRPTHFELGRGELARRFQK